MQPFPPNLYSPLTPLDSQADDYYLNMLDVDLTFAPSLQEAYQDYAPSNIKSPGSADWPLSHYLDGGALSSMSEPSNQLLVGELLSVSPQLQLSECAPPTTNGTSILESTDALLSYPQKTHGSRHTSSTDTTPVLSPEHGNSGIAFVDYSTPIVKSQIDPSYGQMRFKHTNGVSSTPSMTASVDNLKRVVPKKTRPASDTIKQRYKCEKCEETFSRPADRRRHERTTLRHGAMRKYPCKMCKVVLSRQADVARHEEKCKARAV